MTEPTLKTLPCPFCGDQPEFLEHGAAIDEIHFELTCSNENCLSISAWSYTANGDYVIKAWNTRATDEKYNRLLEFVKWSAQPVSACKACDFQTLKAQQLLEDLGELK